MTDRTVLIIEIFVAHLGFQIKFQHDSIVEKTWGQEKPLRGTSEWPVV